MKDEVKITSLFLFELLKVEILLKRKYK